MWLGNWRRTSQRPWMRCHRKLARTGVGGNVPIVRDVQGIESVRKLDLSTEGIALASAAAARARNLERAVQRINRGQDLFHAGRGLR